MSWKPSDPDAWREPRERKRGGFSSRQQKHRAAAELRRYFTPSAYTQGSTWPANGVYRFRRDVPELEAEVGDLLLFEPGNLLPTQVHGAARPLSLEEHYALRDYLRSFDGWLPLGLCLVFEALGREHGRLPTIEPQEVARGGILLQRAGAQGRKVHLYSYLKDGRRWGANARRFRSQLWHLRPYAKCWGETGEALEAASDPAAVEALLEQVDASYS